MAKKSFMTKFREFVDSDACRIQYADDGERNRGDQVEEEGKGDARNRFDEGWRGLKKPLQSDQKED